MTEDTQPHGIILPSDVEIVIASYGGAGSTMLISHLSRFRKTNEPGDRDGFKHCALPPVTLRKGFRFIYVYGDPVDSVISLFSRHYHHEHSAKLQRFILPQVRPIPANMSLAEYACQGEDRFYFREHFQNWYDRCLFHETLFLRYECLHDNIEKLADYLKLPRAFVDEFPARAPRKSTAAMLPATVRKHLELSYRDLSEITAGLDDFEIRSRPGRFNCLKTYGSGAYRNEIREHFDYFCRQYAPNYYRRYASVLRRHGQ